MHLVYTSCFTNFLFRSLNTSLCEETIANLLASGWIYCLA